MARLSLECLFRPERLDTPFQHAAKRQYQKELLFSEIVELMTSVVLRVNSSMYAAYRKRAPRLSVSDQAVYDKLRGMELGVSAALAADSAAQIGPVVDALGARRPAWLPSYRVRAIDGNHLAASERCLRELRPRGPGDCPARRWPFMNRMWIWSPKCSSPPDGHAQERSLLDEVLTSVQSKDLWIADRNFCTHKFLLGSADAEAYFVLLTF
jgi:hypothetical protein